MIVEVDLQAAAGSRVFSGAKNLINPIDAQLMASQVIDYVAAEGTVSPKVEGRIKTAM
jgi:hypothetical protein